MKKHINVGGQGGGIVPPGEPLLSPDILPSGGNPRPCPSHVGHCPTCEGDLLRQPDSTLTCKACVAKERLEVATARFQTCTSEQTRGRRTLEPMGGWAQW